MYFDLDVVDSTTSHRLLVNSVVPRPIALVTTVSQLGVPNAAPFSFFNIMGHDPAVLVLGIQDLPEGAPKDTTANIRATGEFVVNLVSEGMADAMNLTAGTYSPDVNELELAGLTASPSTRVSPPRICESPVSLECKTRQLIDIGSTRSIVLGDIVALHIHDHLYSDETGYVDTIGLQLIARMHGRDWYLRTTTDLFQMARV